MPSMALWTLVRNILLCILMPGPQAVFMLLQLNFGELQIYTRAYSTVHSRQEMSP